MVTVVSCMQTTWTCCPSVIHFVPSVRRRTFFEPQRTTSRWFVRPTGWPWTTTSASAVDFTVSAPSNESNGFASAGGGVDWGGALLGDAGADAEVVAAAEAGAAADSRGLAVGAAVLVGEGLAGAWLVDSGDVPFAALDAFGGGALKRPCV